jgi:Na+/H+ antiporter NhaD/arsenite permease-like protein
VLGYLLIVFEHQIRINKSASALAMGSLLWIFYTISNLENLKKIEGELAHHLAEIAGIVFFLLGAMTIVELIDLHEGFRVITDNIRTRNRKFLLIILSFLTFFLSAVFDNLTTAILMGSIISKLVTERRSQLIMGGIVVIAANAGGAWSPIGDVTTTMLWSGGQISAVNIIGKLFLPSLICLLVPLSVGLFLVSGEAQSEETRPVKEPDRVIFFMGMFALISVPVLKTLTHLPPYIGMLLALSGMWLITELRHRNITNEDRTSFSVSYALQRVDTPSNLFFLGILLAVACLSTAGYLKLLAKWLSEHISNLYVIGLVIGVLSAVVDNVPLVAAVQKMYNFEMDHPFWEFIAYTAGTGGSLLIIGSAAGVAMMGILRMEFFWYLFRIGWLALLGYLAGALTYLAFL